MTTTDPVFVLVHGAWHNSTVWRRLATGLGARGAYCITPDLPGHGGQPGHESLASHVEFVENLLRPLDRDLVLVGHSYGGLVVSGVGRLPRLRRRIYVTAFPGPMSVTESYADGEVSPLAGRLVREADGRWSVPAELAARELYGDCSFEQVEESVKELEPQAARTLTASLPESHAVRHTSVYVRCTADCVVPWSTQTRLSRVAATVIDIESGHSPMLSVPEQLADILIAAATGGGGNDVVD
jgi:pimeloyl-ACP methyl ester carboxylesterase